jgi:hypothetical protein
MDNTKSTKKLAYRSACSINIFLSSQKQTFCTKRTQQSVHPTLGILRHFQAFFYASAFFQSDGVPPPAPARVTQTVSPHVFLLF